MNIGCWIKGGNVFVPTVVETVDGLYLWQEPLDISPIGDTENLIRLLKDRASLGVKIVPRGSYSKEKNRELLNKMGGKNWSEFQKKALIWSFREENDIFQMKGHRKSASGGYESDPEQTTILPEGTSIDEAFSRFVSAIQAAAATQKSTRQVKLPKPLPFLGDDGLVHLPGIEEERVGELEDLLEWIANAKPSDEADIRSDIKLFYDDKGDAVGSRAMRKALTLALKPDITIEARLDLLQAYDRYTLMSRFREE